MSAAFCAALWAASAAFCTALWAASVAVAPASRARAAMAAGPLVLRSVALVLVMDTVHLLIVYPVGPGFPGKRCSIIGPRDRVPLRRSRYGEEMQSSGGTTPEKTQAAAGSPGP